MQEADVFRTIGIAILAADSQRAQLSMRGGQWQADHGTQLASLGLQRLPQRRKTGVGAPVGNVQSLLRPVNVPTGHLLNRQVGTDNLELPVYTPFDLVGILFENKNIEIVETEQFAQLVGENL